MLPCRVRQYPCRIAALHQLTGGNPRTTVLLFHLYAEDFAPTVFGDLEQLLDRVTPLYKARFEELSQQMQVVAGAMANHWDPITARQLAEATGLAQNQVSPQLDRLKKLEWADEVEVLRHGAGRIPDCRKVLQYLVFDAECVAAATSPNRVSHAIPGSVL